MEAAEANCSVGWQGGREPLHLSGGLKCGWAASTKHTRGHAGLTQSHIEIQGLLSGTDYSIQGNVSGHSQSCPSGTSSGFLSPG